MTRLSPVSPGQILTGSLFSESMRVETVLANGPARLDWNEVTKVAHYYLAVNATTKPMQVCEDSLPYEGMT